MGQAFSYSIWLPLLNWIPPSYHNHMSISAWLYNHLSALLVLAEVSSEAASLYEPAALWITFVGDGLLAFTWIATHASGECLKQGARNKNRQEEKWWEFTKFPAHYRVYPSHLSFCFNFNLLNCKLFVESYVPLMFQQATSSMGRLGRLSIGKLFVRPLIVSCFSHTEVNVLRHVKKGASPLFLPHK